MRPSKSYRCVNMTSLYMHITMLHVWDRIHALIRIVGAKDENADFIHGSQTNDTLANVTIESLHESVEDAV